MRLRGTAADDLSTWRDVERYSLCASSSSATLQRLIQQKVLESDSANRAAIEPIRTDDQQFLAGKCSDKPIELEWRSVTGLYFDPRSALADEIDLVFFRTPEQRLQG